MLSNVRYKAFLASAKLAILAEKNDQERASYFQTNFSFENNDNLSTLKTKTRINPKLASLMRGAIQFKKQIPRPERITFETILNEARDNALVSLDLENHHSFDTAVQEICMLIKFGYDAFTIPALGEELVLHQTSFFSTSQFMSWKRIIFEICEKATAEIPNDNAYFQIVLKNFSKFHSENPALLSLTLYSYTKLIHRIILEAKDDRTNDAFVARLREVLGAFNALKMMKLEKREIDWKVYTKDFLEIHIQYIRGIARHTTLAAQYSLQDIFKDLKEFLHSISTSKLLQHQMTIGLDENKSKALTLDSFQHDFPTLFETIRTNFAQNNISYEEELASKVLENYLNDLNMLVVASIFERSWRITDTFDLVSYVNEFLKDHDWPQEEFYDQAVSAPEHSDLIESFFRINVKTDDMIDDNTRLLNFSESLSGFYEEPRVSLRAYNSGPNYSGREIKAQLLSILFKVPPNSQRIFYSNSNNNLLSNFTADPENDKLLKLIKRSIEVLMNFDEFVPIYMRFDQTFSRKYELARLHAIAISDLGELLDSLEEARTYAIVNGAVSSRKLASANRQIKSGFLGDNILSILNTISIDVVDTSRSNKVPLLKFALERKYMTIADYSARTAVSRERLGEAFGNCLLARVVAKTFNTQTGIELSAPSNDINSIIRFCDSEIQKLGFRTIVMGSRANQRELNALPSDVFHSIICGRETGFLGSSILIFPATSIDEISIELRDGIPRISSKIVDVNADPIELDTFCRLRVQSHNHGYFQINVDP